MCIRDSRKVVGGQLFGGDGVAQYDQAFDFVGEKLLYVLPFDLFVVVAGKNEEFVSEFFVGGQKVCQHLSVVVHVKLSLIHICFKRKPISVKKPEPTLEEKWQSEYLRCLRAYLDYRSLLVDWKLQYAPKNRKEEWDKRFMTALRELTTVDYYLDILLFGDQAEKEALVNEDVYKRQVEGLTKTV